MRKYLSVLVAIGLFFVVGCRGSQVNHDGVYAFDTTQWLEAMKNVDPKFADAPQEMVDNMTAAFQAFSFNIKGNMATANFGSMVVEGTLEKVSEGIYKMTPTDEDKKDQPILITITEEGILKAGPENKPKETLYFKKK